MIQPALSDAKGAPGMQPQEALHDCLLDATQACLGGQWERALALVDVALASYPDDGELLHLKGLSLLRAGQRESAIHCFRRAAHFRPGVAQIHFDLAAVCAEL